MAIVDLDKPIRFEDVDAEFLRKLFLLSKTYLAQETLTSKQISNVKDFVDYGFLQGRELSPTEVDYNKPFIK